MVVGDGGGRWWWEMVVGDGGKWWWDEYLEELWQALVMSVYRHCWYYTMPYDKQLLSFQLFVWILPDSFFVNHCTAQTVIRNSTCRAHLLMQLQEQNISILFTMRSKVQYCLQNVPITVHNLQSGTSIFWQNCKITGVHLVIFANCLVHGWHPIAY